MRRVTSGASVPQDFLPRALAEAGAAAGASPPGASSAVLAIEAGVALYAAAGILFAILFALRGAPAIDPVARRATWGFRLLVLPGAALLWPWLLGKWRRAAARASRGEAPEVAGEAVAAWMPRSEALRARALVLWLVLGPLAIAALAVALLVKPARPAAGADALRLPAPPIGAGR